MDRGFFLTMKHGRPTLPDLGDLRSFRSTTVKWQGVEYVLGATVYLSTCAGDKEEWG
jgi:hypothetical protein